jgi:hypothetical protein
LSLEHAGILAVVAGACGVAFLGLFWPGERHGRRLLARWGIPAPEGQEIAHAVTYLRSRRVWYPWAFAGFGLLAGLWPDAGENSGGDGAWSLMQKRVIQNAVHGRHKAW